MKKKAKQESKAQPGGYAITNCVFQVGPAKNEPVPVEAIVAIANAANEVARALSALAGATKGPEHTYTGHAINIGRDA